MDANTNPSPSLEVKTELKNENSASIIHSCEMETKENKSPLSSNCGDQRGDKETTTNFGTKPCNSEAVRRLSYVIEDYHHPALNSTHDLKNTFHWNTLIRAAPPKSFQAMDVTMFRHAPMSDCWNYIGVGIKVEVENTYDVNEEALASGQINYWTASVIDLAGYIALLRFEGFDQDDSKDFWIHMCSDKIHPIGWCRTKGKSLVPPYSIRGKYSNWKEYLLKRLTGSRTIPVNFYKKICESVGSIFSPSMRLEVVDKNRISQVRVATIKQVIGRRLTLTYVSDNDMTDDQAEFCCHEESPLVHPVGWAQRVGHQIVASQDYMDMCLMEDFGPNDCTSDMFPEYRIPPGSFEEGMKLEAVDPINLACICVATVTKVLRFGYLMIRIDAVEEDVDGNHWFCYHSSSNLIFPVGFCDRNNIELMKPADYQKKFDWSDYLRETNSVAAPTSLFIEWDPQAYKNVYKVGMKLECTDQIDPTLICVATIVRSLGSLIKVHFDGWDDEFDQWMDIESVDIYPVGWAELVGHKFEGPKISLVPPPTKKEKKKLGGRKSKKRSVISDRHISTVTKTESPTLTLPPPLKCVSMVSNESDQAEQPEATSPSQKMDTDEVNASLNSNNITPRKIIPRLVASPEQTTPSSAAVYNLHKDGTLDPATWNASEVASFLNINGCSTLSEAFIQKEIDGASFLELSSQEIMSLVDNKIGPFMKVENLLQLLNAKMNPAQARFNAASMKKIF